MKNKFIYISLLLIFLFPKGLYAQTEKIGINMDSPQHPLHINTSNESDASDDIVITSAGNMGIGTDSPINKVDLRGTMRYVDGQEGMNRSLVSDANGFANWAYLAFAKRVGVWTIKGNANSLITDATSLALSPQVAMEENEIGLTVTNNVVTIPQGRYIMMFTGEFIGVKEYVAFSFNFTTIDTFVVAYRERACLGNRYIELAADTEISYDIRSVASARPVKTVDDNLFYQSMPYPNNTQYEYKITLLKLE